MKEHLRFYPLRGKKNDFQRGGGVYLTFDVKYTITESCLALVGPYPGVGPQVAAQSAALAEELQAEVALVAFSSTAGRRWRQSALWLPVRLEQLSARQVVEGVQLGVGVKADRVDKLLRTAGTLVEAEAGGADIVVDSVDLHVVGQVVVLREVPVAHRALKLMPAI